MSHSMLTDAGRAPNPRTGTLTASRKCWKVNALTMLLLAMFFAIRHLASFGPDPFRCICLTSTTLCGVLNANASVSLRVPCLHVCFRSSCLLCMRRMHAVITQSICQDAFGYLLVARLHVAHAVRHKFMGHCEFHSFGIRRSHFHSD